MRQSLSLSNCTTHCDSIIMNEKRKLYLICRRQMVEAFNKIYQKSKQSLHQEQFTGLVAESLSCFYEDMIAHEFSRISPIVSRNVSPQPLEGLREPAERFQRQFPISFNEDQYSRFSELLASQKKKNQLIKQREIPQRKDIITSSNLQNAHNHLTEQDVDLLCGKKNSLENRIKERINAIELVVFTIVSTCKKAEIEALKIQRSFVSSAHFDNQGQILFSLKQCQILIDIALNDVRLVAYHAQQVQKDKKEFYRRYQTTEIPLIINLKTFVDIYNSKAQSHLQFVKSTTQKALEIVRGASENVEAFKRSLLNQERISSRINHSEPRNIARARSFDFTSKFQEWRQ